HQALRRGAVRPRRAGELRAASRCYAYLRRTRQSERRTQLDDATFPRSACAVELRTVANLTTARGFVRASENDLASGKRQDQDHDEKNEEDNEQDLGELPRAAREAGITKGARDQRDQRTSQRG